MHRQITLFRMSPLSKQCTAIFKVSIAWTKLWDKMMQEKAVIKKQKSKKGFEKNEHVCSMDSVTAWREFFLVTVSDSTARPLLRLAGLTRTNQSSSKLRQFESDKQKSRTRRWGSLAWEPDYIPEFLTAKHAIALDLDWSFFLLAPFLLNAHQAAPRRSRPQKNEN